jgi:RNA polymerase sigma-70 factor, ECF subfamily
VARFAEPVPVAWHDEGVEDHALVDALRSGDRGAFALLIQRETRSVYQSAYRILGRPADAEDVTQEAFVAAYRSIGTFRGEGSLRGWLMRIATRIAFRRLAQRRDAADLAAVPEPMLADRSTEPVVAVMTGERQRAVRDAIAALPDPYREVVALRFLADLSLAEVAEATDRPLNTVKTHLRRGLERLRPTLAAEVDGGMADR